jgi:hypothetical protein
MKSFKYKKSFKTFNWGCSFDSLLELRFAISIHEDYEFLRSPISIYYDPATKQPTDYIRLYTRRYTPDFLIRHKVTGEAFWVEVKPGAFTDQKQLALRREVAEKYIHWKKYDWKFRFIFDDEISLNNEQQAGFEKCCQMKSLSAFKIKFRELNNKYDQRAPLLFQSAPSPLTIQFAMFGSKNTNATAAKSYLFSSSGKTKLTNKQTEIEP